VSLKAYPRRIAADFDTKVLRGTRSPRSCSADAVAEWRSWYHISVIKPETPLIFDFSGCSSSTGLLFELGPCSIRNEGKNTTRNPYSWNMHSNMIFLDQPVNVGYSYGDASVDTSPVAGQDVYAFLELFVNRFPEYADKQLHLSAESYGGT